MISGENENKLSSVVFGVIVFLITLGVFSGALDNEFVNYDDNIYTYENPVVKFLDSEGGSNIFQGTWNIFAGMHHYTYWHPMAWFSHALDYKFYKLDPWGHHLTSIVIHSITSAVVYFLFATLVGVVRPEYKRSWNLMAAAAMVALAYSLHPLRVEAVVWVAERKEVLAGFFYFSGLLTYLHYVFAKSRGKRFVFFAGTFLLFSLGLISKPHVVTFPVILLLLDWYPLKRFIDWNKSRTVIFEKIPFLLTGFVFSVITMTVQKGAPAVSTLADISLGERLWNSVGAFSFYIEKTVWPSTLIPFYPLEKSPSIFSPTFIFSAVLIFGISFLCVKFWRKGNALFLAAWIYYLVAIFPAIGFIRVGQQGVADRFRYSSTLSFYFLLGIGVLWFLSKKRSSHFQMRFKSGFILCAIFIIVLSGFQTQRQTNVWKNSEALWIYVLHYFPDRVPRARNNMGLVRAQQGNYEEAIEHYYKAIKLWPDFSEVHSNLGVALVEQNMISEAIFHYGEAIRYQPNYAEAHSNLGVALSRTGKTEEAILHYLEAIKLKPTFVDAYYNLGLAQGQQRNIEEAIVNFKKAISLDPDYAEAHSDLGVALSLSGNPKEATTHFKKALRIKPNFAIGYFNFGNSLAQQEKFQESILYFEKAIKNDPKFAQAHYLLGRVLSIVGKPEDAEKHLNRAQVLKGK